MIIDDHAHTTGEYANTQSIIAASKKYDIDKVAPAIITPDMVNKNEKESDLRGGDVERSVIS